MTKILVVEDNQKIHAHMTALLRDEGYDVHGVYSAEEARPHLLAGEPPRLVLLDIRLGGISGLDLIRDMGHTMPPTIVISGEATISEALEALRMGIHDFVEKPFSDERFLCSVRNCLEKIELQEKIRQLEANRSQSQSLLGESPSMRAVMHQIQKVAPTKGRVLITGESGTGKELVASTIHHLSQRRGKPFVKINCAAFPVHLIEDELFGHVKGAFTDARQNKKGLFEESHGGTLFLDEIGDMDYQLQARLLRVLEDGKVRRIGDTHEREVDVRVIAATNQDLRAMIDEQKFREDLYYRLASLPIEVPPLRSRKADIPLLVTYYVSHFCKEHQIRPKRMGDEAMEALQYYNWPGNIRELKNLCERLTIFGGDPIGTEDLPSHIFAEENKEASGLIRISEVKPMSLKAFKNQCEKEFLETMLIRTNWNYVKVAQHLEINRSYLHQKITSLGIQRKKGRS
ncbi:Sigma-54-dependent Fis family transcriptional regulator [Sulfidibacter corallicola]|uniref:Sigma-54-dependent Fis family transcriptional regulator n=1 Tax=Sulfidibacter corallicola TaxID=2818388 RepID=A0A8A4U560_SULCO|nr:sigma-54 dependent transcriptional regulator [Sulfidibacter corallicola]QTD53885.1 sigma-54-dependent Fis family transcriptional regulator [Sulfidibacter corallicola]